MGKSTCMVALDQFFSLQVKREEGSLRTQIVNQLLAKNGEERVDAIDSICIGQGAEIERQSLMKPTATQGMLERIKKLYRELAVKLLRDGDVYPFLGLLNRTRSQEELALLQEDVGGGMLRMYGRGRFAEAFFEVMESSLEHSLQFALGLFELQAAPYQEPITNEMLAQRKISNLVLGRRAGLAIEFLVTVACAEPHTNPPSSAHFSGFNYQRWLEIIVENAEHMAVASDILKSVAELLAIMANTPLAESLRGEHDQEVRGRNRKLDAFLREYPVAGKLMEQLFKPRLKLVEPYNRMLQAWMDAQETRERIAREAGDTVIEEFIRRESEFTDIMKSRWQAICENPHCWLRPDGGDHIEIQLAPLVNVGVRSVVFFPTGFQFPETGIRILTRKETPHLLVFTTALCNGTFETHDEMVRHKMHFEHRPVLERMLRYVVVDAMYRIVASDRALRSKTVRKPVGANGVVDLAAQTVPVRPHFSFLPAGHHASEQARERLKGTLGWSQFPPGKTFVRAHYRGAEGGLVYQIPTEPVAIYGYDDFFNIRRSP